MVVQPSRQILRKGAGLLALGLLTGCGAASSPTSPLSQASPTATGQAATVTASNSEVAPILMRITLI